MSRFIIYALYRLLWSFLGITTCTRAVFGAHIARGVGGAVCVGMAVLSGALLWWSSITFLLDTMLFFYDTDNCEP